MIWVKCRNLEGILGVNEVIVNSFCYRLLAPLRQVGMLDKFGYLPFVVIDSERIIVVIEASTPRNGCFHIRSNTKLEVFHFENKKKVQPKINICV